MHRRRTGRQREHAVRHLTTARVTEEHEALSTAGGVVMGLSTQRRRERRARARATGRERLDKCRCRTACDGV
eukprot:1043426-Prymnesium_polylepis.1